MVRMVKLLVAMSPVSRFLSGAGAIMILGAICLIMLYSLSQAQTAPRILSTSLGQNELDAPVSSARSVTSEVATTTDGEGNNVITNAQITNHFRNTAGVTGGGGVRSLEQGANERDYQYNMLTTFQFTFHRALPAPDGNVFKLGFGDDGYLWVHGEDSDTFYKLDPLNGNIIQSFPSAGWFSDVDVKDGILYAVQEPEIFRYDIFSGDQLSTLNGPVDGGSRGLTFVGGDLYVSGVLTGYPGVRLGRVDPSDGTLLGSSAPPDLISSCGIGAIDQYICYLVEPGGEDEGEVVLNIVDPSSGNLIESHVLFEAGQDLWSLDASDTELFITRRDLYPGEIWVYGFGSPTPPNVVSTSPDQNELHIPVSTNISVTFDTDMNQSSITNSNFVVNARYTGLHQGVITYDGPSRTATLNPTEDFDVGEVVTVVLTTDIQSSGGAPLASSYTWSFTVEADDGTGLFGTAANYPVGQEPWSVFAGDLDGDGDLDLATANWWDHNVSILLNNGGGTFAPHAIYPVHNCPLSVFAADLDGDGDLDLATGSDCSQSVSVLLNNGNGTFAAHVDYMVVDNPWSVFAADLDGDGDLDLATACRDQDVVSILFNNGNGTFGFLENELVGDGATSICAADLDGDGDLDLATANLFSDDVSVLMNNGDGTMLPASAYPAGNGPTSVRAADFDSDSDLDLAVANGPAGEISILLNNGAGVMSLDAAYTVGADPVSAYAVDFDGDGDLDIATANMSSHNVSVLLNDGTGSFAPHSVYPVGYYPMSVFGADLNGDGAIDLATADEGSHQVSVLFNQDCHCGTLWGDVNDDSNIDPLDVSYLVNYVYLSLDARIQPPSCPNDAGDVNCDDSVDPLDVTYYVNYVYLSVGNFCPDPCTLEGQLFIRGDLDADGSVNPADLSYLVNYLDNGVLPPNLCDDAADINDDGNLDDLDIIYLTNRVFLGGPPPPAPYPNCGLDPTFDLLGCAGFPMCGN